MSYQASEWAARQVVGSGAGKCILMILAEAADAAGHTFVGHDELARRSEFGKRTVVDQMARLESLGLIKRTRRYNSADGSRTSNGVTLQLHLSAADAPREPVQSAEDAPRDIAKVQETARLSAANDAPKCISRTLSSHEPVNNQERAARTSRRQPETSIAEGFPDGAAIERARVSLATKGWNIDAAIQAEVFRNHARTNDRRCRNWAAAFDNWIIKAIEFAKPSDRISQIVPTEAVAQSSDDVWRPRLRSLKASSYWNTTDWGPKPGNPACLAPAGLLAEFGHGPENVISLAMASGS